MLLQAQIRLALALLAFANVAPSLATLQRRNDPSYSVSKRESIDYEALRQGLFHSGPKLNPIHAGSLWEQYHKTRILYNSRPIYYAEPASTSRTTGFSLPRLQRGLIDFDKIHVFGEPENGETTLTISKDPHGNPVTREAHEDVHHHAMEALSARKTFGNDAAVVAYGYKLKPAPKQSWLGFRKTPRPPKWAEVWKAEPVPSTIGVDEARERLNEQRFLRFSSSDGRTVLGVRLLGDGNIEREWLVASKPVFHIW